MNLFTIPLGADLLGAVASAWLNLASESGAPQAGLILLPTRRSARALADAFLRAAGGRPLLLPRITAIGALDEAPLALSGALDLPPAVPPARRLAVLARMILALDGHAGAPRTADRAWSLAAALADLMDEADRAGVDLRIELRDAADESHAAHWAQTLDFMRIVTDSWPEFLAEAGFCNPAWRQTRLLEAQSAAWTARPPEHPVWVAGVTAGMPSVAALLRAVAGLPNGRVILPGLDATMDDALWAALEPGHPQAGFARLLADIGATRGDVAPWPGVTETPRAALLARALLPAEGLSAWRTPMPPLPRERAGVRGLSRLQAADQAEEAAAIALILRGALEGDPPGRRAALVTPDRELAGRVAAELLRFGIVADDSAGEPLSLTPHAVFLRLIAQAFAQDLAPVPLLALLKHPLFAAGLPLAAARAAARALELSALRGPRPPPGLAGLRRRLDLRSTPAARDLLARLERCLEPWMRVASSVRAPPAGQLAALLRAAEALAATDEQPGAERLWSGEEGEALSTVLADALDALEILPDQAPDVLPGLLDGLLEGAVVRSRRALRGRDAVREHPRVFIWGLLEARLQTAHVIVLGGLAEGVWPPATDPGPWLSRPMRAKMGLDSPEARIGQAAHDFTAAACAAPFVVLSCPVRRDGAPAVPARWLTRLETMLGGLPRHPAASWARLLDRPDHPRPALPPRPCPPLARRPRTLSVTAIETWLRDPYAIHARHILNLRPLDPIDVAREYADYGSIVHAGIHGALGDPSWPMAGPEPLRIALARAMRSMEVHPAIQAWWTPRLARIAAWVTLAEQARRPAVTHLQSEIRGSWAVPGADFTLTGRADRIERRGDGLLAILDYKTGTPPATGDIQAGRAPQLLLEAAMAQAGAFGPGFAHVAGELAYWHLTGGAEPGHEHPLLKSNPAAIAAAVQDAAEGLGALIASYDDPDRPYLSHPWAAHAPRFADYAHLARVAEWAAAGDDS